MTIFRPNPGFESEAERDPEYRDGLKQAGESVKRNAEVLARAAGAPWMPRSGHETIEVVEEGDEVFVVNTDHGGHLMEFGGKNNPPSAPLRQGARSAGLRVDEQR